MFLRADDMIFNYKYLGVGVVLPILVDVVVEEVILVWIIILSCYITMKELSMSTASIVVFKKFYYHED